MPVIKFNNGVFKTKDKKLALVMMDLLFQRENKKEIKKLEKLSGLKIKK